MRYFVRFVGHIIQQPGVVMPREVYYDVISDFEKEDYEPQVQGEKVGLKQFVNIITFQLMEHGMIVPLNPNKTQDGTKLRFDQRMGVPKHMIAYITVIVKTLVAPKPTLPPDLAMFETGQTGEPDDLIVNGEKVN
jgi:hypothetical protein